VSDEMVVVVAGGEPPDVEAARSLPPNAPVVAADRGLDHALALGLDVTVAVGDFDSASPEAVAAAEKTAARIERHPAAKDATDLELALDTALTLRPERILVIAGVGERLDHLFSALLLLGAERYASAQLEARIGRSHAYVIRDERTLDGRPGELVSLFALGGRAEGVHTDGLAYPLTGETLEPGSSRGMSNEFVGASARVSLERGTLLAIRPGVEAEEPK
jgi:thiamine pyrophosphokinase